MGELFLDLFLKLENEVISDLNKIVHLWKRVLSRFPMFPQASLHFCYLHDELKTYTLSNHLFIPPLPLLNLSAQNRQKKQSEGVRFC